MGNLAPHALGRVAGRNAATTRTTLLEAGAYWFARKSYDHVNVREIADRAGVAPALINRYFGSKALLFSELLAEAGHAANPLDGDISNLGERLAAFMLADPDVARDLPGGSSLMILLHSIASIGVQDLVVDQVRQLATQRLVDMLEGAEREQRAALIFGYLIGCLMIRQMVPLTATTTLCLADAIQHCVEVRP
ncbi:TetR/AcrR family transcriptional regulator [Lichenicoccus roseus]|uniref:TetR/AcrR family transcriptional regulator n=1 Tax=Lichenicoccus roseus TaxID=2683649 RepID=A0A5R9JF90_9PROT|nr:TetR/AcrR family transcriptional regulator [Lichenicoccus roseus]TLU74311.1 TetR/AcrR family transcriptional regulator [Lichenicoccus roseus]